MKHLLQCTTLFLITGTIFYVSCKKEYSCENCGEANKPPVANAGKDTSIILPADSIMLDGSKSTDPDDGITSYKWAKIAGPDTFNIISASSTKTVANKLVKAAYQFQLTVTDKGGLSAMDTMLVTVYPAGTTNRPPIANAGSDTTLLLPANAVTLDGSGTTDPDNNIVSYLWTKISGPASLNILSANTIQTPVTSLVQGIYLFELKATDAGGLISTDTIQVTVITSILNRPPVSKAGKDTTIFLPINNVTLDGSGSTDPDNNISDYIWTKISGPASFNISNANAVQTLVSNLILGLYEFELKVTDSGGLQSVDTIKVTVAAPNIIIACDGAVRQQVPAQLTPAGNLSITRKEVSIASAGNKILFAGGYTSPGAPTARVDIFDITTSLWTTAELSEARGSMATAVLGNNIFFAGGSNSSSRVDIYNVTSGAWTTANLSIGRSLISAAAAGNKVVFAGGVFNYLSAPPVDIYDVSTNTWSTDTLRNRPTQGIINDAGIAATTIGNKIYFAGNASDWFGFDFGSITSTINIYDVTTNTWSTSDMSMERGFMASIAVGSKNYWAGGVYRQPGITHGPYTNQVEIRDMNTGVSTSGCLFQPNGFFSAVQKNNKIVFFTSGQVPFSLYPETPLVFNKFDIYDIPTNTWTIGVLPVTIYGCSIISVNNTIYVAGGFVNGVLSNQVWKLGF